MGKNSKLPFFLTKSVLSLLFFEAYGGMKEVIALDIANHIKKHLRLLSDIIAICKHIITSTCIDYEAFGLDLELFSNDI